MRGDQRVMHMQAKQLCQSGPMLMMLLPLAFQFFSAGRAQKGELTPELLAAIAEMPVPPRVPLSLSRTHALSPTLSFALSLSRSLALSIYLPLSLSLTRTYCVSISFAPSRPPCLCELISNGLCDCRCQY